MVGHDSARCNTRIQKHGFLTASSARVARGGLPSFVRSILDGAHADVTEKEVFDAMNVSLAIEESLLAGQPVDLEYEDWDAR